MTTGIFFCHPLQGDVHGVTAAFKEFAGVGGVTHMLSMCEALVIPDSKT
jgi:hypothetical protein